VQLDADHAAPAASREKACRPAEARADVQHARHRLDTGAPGEHVDRADAAIVVLVEVEEVVGRQRASMAPGGAGADMCLVDRMPVVEVDGSGSPP
jgi:hypothetical protein